MSPSPAVRPHDVLGVSPAATPSEVTAAFRRFALRNHPDRGGDPERFRAGAEAYRRLLAAAGPAAGPATGPPAPASRADVVFHRRPRPGLSGLLARARHGLARRRRP